MKIDPRGQRFAAGLSCVILAAVLVTGSAWLLAAQAVAFGVPALAGARYSPYGFIFRSVIGPRLGPPAVMEDAAAPRFAQGVGLVVSSLGVIGYAVGVVWLGMAGAAAALVAAFLNAVFGLCLGCEMYVIVRRIRPVREPIKAPPESDREVPA